MADKKIFANQGPTKPDVPKTVFDLSHCNNLTARAGRAYPVFTYLAPAGSSLKIRPHAAFDMMPLAFPIQTNVRCHLSFYKIPLRILWKHYKDFEGQHAADGSVATAATQLRIPYIQSDRDWYKTGSLADYMGLPSVKVESQVIRKTVNRSFIFATNSSYEPVSLVHNTDSNEVDINYITSQSNRNSLGCFVPLQGDDILDAASPIAFKIANLNTTSNISVKVVFFKKASTPLNPQSSRNVTYIPNSTVQSANLTYSSSSNLGSSKVFYLHLSGFGSYVTEADGFLLMWASNLYNTLGDIQSDSYRAMSSVSNLTISTILASSGENKYASVSRNPANGLLGSVTYSTKAPIGDTEKYFKSPDGVAAPDLPISALPFRAYEFIYNYFFRNERLTPFTKNGNPVFNEFITNDGDGADSTTPLDFWHAPFEYDLFTTCVKTPQFGNAPLVGITTNLNDSTAYFTMNNISTTSEGSTATYNIGVQLDDNHKIVQITNYDEVADKPSVLRLQEAIQYGISINDFRNVNALQRFQERYLKAGTKYQNIVYEFFGTNPPIGEEFPEYLGGTTTNINVSKVTSQGDSALGDFVGQGSFNSKGSTIRCFCAENSYIMGIMYFTITPTYSQMLPAHFTKSRLLDFYNPQFANIGLQPVYNHQIAPLQIVSADKLGEVFGYNRPYADYVSMQDEVHGDFRESMANFLCQRIFDSVPDLSQRFIECHPEDMTNVFLDTTDNDKFFGQIYFDIKAKLPLPKFAVPRII